MKPPRHPQVDAVAAEEDFRIFSESPSLGELNLPPDLLGRLRQYGEFVQGRAAGLNLVAAGDRPRLFTRHVAECLVPPLVERARSAGRILDLGTGGGLPGIPLAIVCPQATVLLVESRTRKAQFLETTVTALGLSGRVEVFHGSVDLLIRTRGDQPRAGLVTARAVADLPRTWEWGRILLAPGGWLATYKGVDEVPSPADFPESQRPARIESYPVPGAPRIALLLQTAS